MYRFIIFGLIFIGFIGSISLAEDSVDLNKKYRQWEPNNSDPDDIRCYCNLPRCIATGYMCRTARSSTGGCFSEVTKANEKSTTSRRGCIELIQNDNPNLVCNNLPMKSSKPLLSSASSSSTIDDMLVLCCHEDMCNHVDRPDHKKQKLNTTNRNDEDFLPKVYIPDSQSDIQLCNYPTVYSHNNNEVWLKAATIAVPICGGIILLILIALAIRILRNDGIESGSSGNGARKVALDFEAYGAHTHNIKQVPLLKQNSNDYFNNQSLMSNDLKNECLAKTNQLSKLEYSLLSQSCSDPSNKPTNTETGGTSLYRNVNLSMKQSNRVADSCDNKVYEKEVLNPTPFWAGSGN